MRTHLIMAAAIGAIASAASAGDQFTSSILAADDGDVVFQGALGFTADTTDTRIGTSRSGGSNVRHGVYEFSLASLPDGAMITGATLRLTTASLISNTSATADIEFYAYAGDGMVTELDHGDQMDAMGSLVADETYGSGINSPPVGTQLDIAFDTLSVLQDASDADAGFLTVRSETFNFTTFNIHSLETNNSTVLRPTLEITYVPAPAGASMLLVAGGAGLIRRRR